MLIWYQVNSHRREVTSAFSQWHLWASVILSCFKSLEEELPGQILGHNKMHFSFQLDLLTYHFVFYSLNLLTCMPNRTCCKTNLVFFMFFSFAGLVGLSPKVCSGFEKGFTKPILNLRWVMNCQIFVPFSKFNVLILSNSNSHCIWSFLRS